MIRLTIDGQDVTVPQGTMIVDAAAKLGVDVPIYCYHQALGPLGACRMCLVEVEKMPKLATACTTAVSEGMVVRTSGPAVDKGRRGVLEFLLINHPLDCPVCDKGGECFLQDYTFEYGPGGGRFQEPKIEKVKDGPINPFVLIDQERCVLCQRCVRFMREYVGEEQLLLEGRGVETVVTTVEHEPATSQFTGNVIDLCPVGALLSAPYHHKGRPWNIEREESVCPHCPVGCTSKITAREGHVIRMEGRPIPDREWGWLCDRGRFGYDFGYHPDRLATSIVKGKENTAAQATRQVAEWLKTVVDQEGGRGVGFIIGGGHTTEEAYQLRRFAAEVIGTDQLAISRTEAGYLPRGLNGTFDDVKQADAVVLLGSDPYDTVPVVHLKLRDRLLHYPALRVIGLGPLPLTRDTLPGLDVLVPPGQESLALALAMAAQWPQNSEVQTLVGSLKEFELQGVTAQTLVQLGQYLQGAEHLVLLWDGKEPEMAMVLGVLARLREKPTAVLPTFGPANWRGYEHAGFSPRFEDLTAVLEKARDGEIKMLMVFGADLLREYPNRQLVEAAFNQVEYLVVEGLLPPQGAQHVDALLPGAAWAEVYGTYINMEARLQVAMAGVQPPGQARPIKTYINTWARMLMKPLNWDEEWDPFDDDSGDLLPFEPVPDHVVALAMPPEAVGPLTLVTGAFIWESGQPSEILVPRVPQFPGRINPDEVKDMGLSTKRGHLMVSQGSESIVVAVTADPQVPKGILWVPQGLFGANHLIEGTVTISGVTEEVTV